MRTVDIANVQTGAQLEHALSKRSYEIIDRDRRLWHREWEHFRPAGAEPQPADPKLRLAELPVEYIMGSGHYAEAYLLRDGDYLLQSPVTWYTAEGNYGIAPGYDEANHRGCNRVIEDECLFCHAGIVSLHPPQHPKILELAIGCERCHGPSQKHAEYHRSRTNGTERPSEVPDDARSVNPAKLDRAKLESICAQCHLNGDVVVDAIGKSLWDFVPGEEFAATRMTYQADHGDVEDPFSDHFDQLHHSQCYQQSDSLTCVTCHDPHHGETGEDLDTIYRDQCLHCHADEDCGMSLERRISEQQNRCTRCHMPAATSAVVHDATTNHRIGIHSSTASGEQPQSDSPVVLRRLQPVPEDMSPQQLAVTDLLAKAYWFLEQDGDPEKTRGLIAASLEDSLVKSLTDKPSARELTALALLARSQAEAAASAQESTSHRLRSGSYASQALADRSIGYHARVNALEVLASQQHEAGEHTAAIATYRQLVTLRRSTIDHYNLGISLGKLRQFDLAEEAFHQAIRIDASYPLPYRSLSVLYRSVDPNLSSQMANMSQMLLENRLPVTERDSAGAGGSGTP
jgi:hypothetical protein